jgi:phosphate transport system substrate-binding protein
LDRNIGRRGRRLLGVLALVPALLLPLAAACDSAAPGDAEIPPTPTAAPATYQGTIICAGSSALAPLVRHAAAEFSQLAPEAFVLVITSTSQLGLATLQDDGADIAMSDVRAPDLLGADASTLWEYPVAAVPYAVVVNPDTHVTNLTRAQLRRIYNGEVHNWQEVGGANLPIAAFHASKGSGLRYLFRKTILAAGSENDTDLPINASSTNLVGDVSARPGAIGYAALADVVPEVQVVTIDGVAPSNQTIADGTYGFWSYAWLYTKGRAGGLASAFINFVQSPNVQKDVIAPLGFTPMAWMKDRLAP